MCSDECAFCCSMRMCFTANTLQRLLQHSAHCNTYCNTHCNTATQTATQTATRAATRAATHTATYCNSLSYVLADRALTMHCNTCCHKHCNTHCNHTATTLQHPRLCARATCRLFSKVLRVHNVCFCTCLVSLWRQKKTQKSSKYLGTCRVHTHTHTHALTHTHIHMSCVTFLVFFCLRSKILSFSAVFSRVSCVTLIPKEKQKSSK